MTVASRIITICQNLAFFRIPSNDFDRPTRADATKKITSANRIFVSNQHVIHEFVVPMNSQLHDVIVKSGLTRKSTIPP